MAQSSFQKKCTPKWSLTVLMNRERQKWQRHSGFRDKTVTDKNQVLILHNSTPLGLGECGTIVLAEEIGAQRVIIDDRTARRVAMTRGLPIIGIVGVLLVAKTRHIIPDVKPILDNLRDHGTRISQRLYHQTLTTAGE